MDGGQITQRQWAWALTLDNTGHHGPMLWTMEGTNQIPLRWPYHWERHAAIGGIACLARLDSATLRVQLRATNDCEKETDVRDSPSITLPAFNTYVQTQVPKRTHPSESFRAYTVHRTRTNHVTQHIHPHQE